MLRRREGLAGRLRPELGADCFQRQDAGREREAVAFDEVVEFSEQGRGVFVCQLKVHRTRYVK